MQIQIPTSDLKSALNAVLSSALSAQQKLGTSAQTQVSQLIDELYPLITDEVQAMVTGKQPAVAQTYLAVLQGVVNATVAKLGLQALATQQAVLASALQSAVQILALLLKAAVVAV